MKFEALVFDAYGTLFDVHSVSQRCEELWPGRGIELSRLWRTTQLEYTWLRSLMQRYEPFEAVTEQSLRVACGLLGLKCTEPKVKLLMEAYLRLSLFPDAAGALDAMRGRKLAILSNGSPHMLAPLVRHAGVAEAFAGVLSVDAVKVYKPDPRVYRLAVNELGVAAERIGFVSSNCWDACGAKSFGFTTFWINRNDAPVDGLGVAPDHIVKSLGDVPALLAV